jgi:hypothetical protein
MENRGELTWHKSSKSGGGQCVEVARSGAQAHMRDSKDPHGAKLSFDRAVFDDFIAFVKAGGTVDR